MAEVSMRRLSEITFDIEGANRRLAQLVIQQSDLDNEISKLDRRIKYLEAEKDKLNVA
jgi:chromosome segregation ATPase